MPDHPEGLDEEVEAAVEALEGRVAPGYMRVALEAAAPAIRKQEHQRIREALEKLPRFVAQTDDQTEFGGELGVALVRQPSGDLIAVAALTAALDTLEDSGV